MGYIYYLVKKDLVYLSTSLKNLIFMGIIFSIAMPLGSLKAAFIVPVIVGYLFTYAMFAYDEKNKMDSLMASLPVNRKDICGARYLTTILYSFMSMVLVIISLVINMCIKNNFDLPFLIRLVSLLLGITGIYNAIILPILLYFGAIKSKWFMFTTYVLAFVVLGIVGKDNTGNVNESLQVLLTTTNSLIILLVGIVLYIISYKIGVSLYSKKEFK